MYLGYTWVKYLYSYFFGTVWSTPAFLSRSVGLLCIWYCVNWAHSPTLISGASFIFWSFSVGIFLYFYYICDRLYYGGFWLWISDFNRVGLLADFGSLIYFIVNMVEFISFIMRAIFLIFRPFIMVLILSLGLSKLLTSFLCLLTISDLIIFGMCNAYEYFFGFLQSVIFFEVARMNRYW